MSKAWWLGKSVFAWCWLGGFIVIQGIFFWIAAANRRPIFSGNGMWETRDAMMAMSMGFLLVAALFMHHTDQGGKGRGWGFLALYFHRVPSGHQKDEQKFIGPVLTAESIRAAMTAVLVAILIENRSPYLKLSTEPDPDWHSIGPILRDPLIVFYLCVIGVLALSLVTTMVGLLCYEYATKFRWTQDWPKNTLLRKGHHFSTWGFYCLMWSLAVVPALMDYQLAFFTITAVFLVMWLYYFFPVQEGLTPTAKLVILYDPPAVPAQFAEHIVLAQKIPNVRCVEMSKALVSEAGKPPPQHAAIGILSFDSMENLDASMKSEDGKALSTRLAAEGATLLRFEDVRF
jgi:hypothetical protein